MQRKQTHIRRPAVVRLAGVLLIAGVLGGCGWFPIHLEPDSVAGGDTVFYNDLDGLNPRRPVQYSLDVGTTPRDVYIVFTNPTYGTIEAPVVENLSAVSRSITEADPLSEGERALAIDRATSGTVALRDNPTVTDWDAPDLTTGSAVSRSPVMAASTAPPPPGGAETAAKFWVDDRTSGSSVITQIDTTRLFGADIDGKTLEIWVQDTEISVSTQTRVDALAEAFMTAGADNDVYDWVSAVYGEEWSDTPYSNLIPDREAITILLYNIEGNQEGGIVGYFWSKDNFLQSSVSYSNERIMFYVDSETFLSPAVGWSIDSYWPNEIVSTLGHELQHMINYHERSILRDASTATWLNELMSLAAEDLIEQHRLKPGPRGVDPQTFGGGTAGDPDNPNGRLPLYNLANDISLAGWNTSGDVLESYSIAYAFGAYLARNFGGARLFEEIATSSSNGTDTILSESIQAASGQAGMTMEELLWRWGAAVILSDGSAATPYRLNPGEWMDSTAGGLNYRLGSINLYNYQDYTTTTDGPYFDTGDVSTATMPPTSKILYRVGTGLTGTVELEVDFAEGMDFAVVVK